MTLSKATLGSLHYMAEQDNPRERHPTASGEHQGTREAMTTTPSSPQLELTQLFNAKLFCEKMRPVLRRCQSQKAWWLYKSGQWRMDSAKETEKSYNEVVSDGLLAYAMESQDEDEKKKWTKWALQSQNRKMQRDTLELAQSYLPIEPDEFDQKPWYLNCKNGTLDLKSGNLLLHNPEDYLTQMVSVPFDPNMDCPKWKAFLFQIFGGNESLVQFIQRALGYTLTGETSEQVFFFLHGQGANGKSTFVEVLRALLHDYAQQADFSTFQDLKFESRGSASPEIARFKGTRMVTAVESEQGKPLSEVRIKQFTGGDRIVARFLHQNVMEFSPEFKIWLVANHKLKVRESGEAFWRRVMLIPFNITIPPEARNPHLKKELLEELPGILAWAVQGCLEWQKQGLNPPTEVRMATEEYKDEEDTLEDFLRECCQKTPDAMEKAGDLYRAYKFWCEQSAEYCVSQKAFGTRLNEKGHKMKKTGGKKMRLGLRLLQRPMSVEEGSFDGREGDEGHHRVP